MLARYRMHYGRDESLIYISHLDLMRFWERAFRRARLPVTYSEGFTPHARISLAAPLSIGISSEAELLDVWLQGLLPPASILEPLKKQMPSGISLARVWRLPLEAPSLQSQTLFAEYLVMLESFKSGEEVRDAIASFLNQDNIPWQHSRDTGPRHYNLRALVKDIRFLSCGDGVCSLTMKLKADASGSGRPEQVALGLGFEKYPRTIRRTKLVLKGDSSMGVSPVSAGRQ